MMNGRPDYAWDSSLYKVNWAHVIGSYGSASLGDTFIVDFYQRPALFYNV